MTQSKTLYKWSGDLKNGLDKVLKTEKVIEEGITYIVRKEIINVKIPEEFWNLLMGDEDFRRMAAEGEANIGGYRVKRGPKLKVNYEETRVRQVMIRPYRGFKKKRRGRYY